MEKENKNKYLLYLLSGMIIILIGAIVFLISEVVEAYPIRTGLSGYFQQTITEEQNFPKYRANFDPHDNTYYIESTSGDEVISNGKWEQYKDNLYLLYNKESEEVVLITLLHDTFYYRNSKTGEVIEFVSVGPGQATYFE